MSRRRQIPRPTQRIAVPTGNASGNFPRPGRRRGGQDRIVVAGRLSCRQIVIALPQVCGILHARSPERSSAWLEHLVWDQDVAGSNPVAPTIPSPGKLLALGAMWGLIRVTVKFWSIAKRQRGAGPGAMAGLMLLLWLGTFALAAIPQLHQLLHQDAQSLSHHCLVTQIQQHSLLAGPGPMLAPPAPPLEAGWLCGADFQIPHTSDCRLAPSRAPPSLPSPRMIAG